MEFATLDSISRVSPPGAHPASTLSIHTGNQEGAVHFDNEHAHFFPQAAMPFIARHSIS